MHCEFSGGTGKFTWFHASVVVTVDSDGLVALGWDVRLQSSLTELPARPRRSSRTNQEGLPRQALRSLLRGLDHRAQCAWGVHRASTCDSLGTRDPRNQAELAWPRGS